MGTELNGMYLPALGEKDGWDDEINDNFRRVSDLGINPMGPPYNGVFDGVADDHAAITDAMADLPPYSGGAGGGTIILPARPTFISAPLVLSNGITLKGAGRRVSRITGSFNGPLLTSASNAGSDPLGAFVSIRDLYLHHTGTGASARAFYFHQLANLVMERCSVQARPAGSAMAQLRAVILGSFAHVNFGGVTGAEACCLLESANNITTFDDCGFTDAKTGLLSFGGTALTVHGGCHFENLAGGGVYNSALWIDGTEGGTVSGNYWETCPTTGMTFGGSVAGLTRGFVVGGNFMTNMVSPFIDASAARFSTFNPNMFTPGAISTNANGLLLGADAEDCIVHPQFLASGSGAASSVDAGAARIKRLDIMKTILGSRSGNAALADLLTDLASLGYITDSTTA